MRKYLIYILPLFFLSCDGYNKLLKNGTLQEKYDAAKRYYNKSDYARALPLFEELSRIYRGRREAEELYFYYAYCHYGQGEYLMASYHFKNYIDNYPRSSRVEEAAYMRAYCDFFRSLPHELDQTASKAAIEELQLFINQYPESEFVLKANAHIDELRQRILFKAYENARLWFDIGDYKAAMTACSNAVDDYPDIDQRDELLYLAFKAAYLYAKNSVESVQKERFKDALEYYNVLKSTIAEGEYLTKGEELYKKLKEETRKLEQKENNT